jgi:hypothetical protein
VVGYDYQRDDPYVQSRGTAFDDARGILTFRYGSGLRRFDQVLPLGVSAFQTDFIDGFGSALPLMTNKFLPVADPDVGRTASPWPGGDNTNHFFTTQDLFDRRKTVTDPPLPLTFSDRLRSAGYGASSYDRYTFYRLISQLGTDSGPEPAGRIHLNYANVDNAGRVVPNMQTNFIPWGALQFFTNAADRLLSATFSTPATNRFLFGVNGRISITNVPVLVSNQFVYTPSLHRIFQLAANIYDASTNRYTNGFLFPSVFRPTFERRANGTYNDIYIAGWVEDEGGGTNFLTKPLDLNDPVDRLLAGTAPNQNIYGVPWVIGAKKGFPNFNEFAMQSISQITRKLQLRRASTSSKPNATNQMFMVGISNTFAFEAWNSYATNYPRAVEISVANDMTIDFRYTNDVSLDLRGGMSRVRTNLVNFVSLAPNAWQGHGGRLAERIETSFQIPLETNYLFLPDSVYRTESGSVPYFTTSTNRGNNLYFGFEQTRKFPIPQFTLAVSNRIRFIMVDTTTRRVVDYVHLNDLEGVRNLTSELNDTRRTVVLDGHLGGIERDFWLTNRVGGSTLAHVPQGVKNQLEASLGNIPVNDWNDYGIGQASGDTKAKEIAAFRAFVYADAANTNVVMQVPFTPTRKMSQYISWQANDPLVHYTKGDLATLALGTGIRAEIPNGPIEPIPNIRAVNDRFDPWGGNTKSSSLGTNRFDVAVKDPGVKASDDWNFPTNKFPTVGWLGRVHRGTPWQTGYLKANAASEDAWTNWTGNASIADARLTMPVNDRLLFDVFTTAFDENATRGQLNVNQSGLAAWSAALGGVIGLTNSATSTELEANLPVVSPLFIDPAGVSAVLTDSPVWKIWDGVNRERARQTNGVFAKLGDVLSTPELTVQSPILNRSSAVQLERGIDDTTYERLPQMLMGLLRGSDQPRFEIYAYGQALHPANNSVIRSDPHFGLCTNYQVTAEFATRTVVRVDLRTNSLDQLEGSAVVESFNILPPEE